MTIEQFHQLPTSKREKLYDTWKGLLTGLTFEEWLKDSVDEPPFDRDLLTAFKQNSFPVNPRPFANAINAGCEAHGTDWIRSDEAKALLLILMQQAHGQLAVIDLHDEWQRLNKIF